MFDELRGDTCVLGRRFHLAESSEGGVFQFQRAPGCGCGTQGRHLHLGAPFFLSTEGIWMERQGSVSGIFSSS